ncbi:hypothetical protein KAU34_01685 [candidate division WOR-3 bacterium]|nr:hypothetical protein [candidate division WOR-3 bacterium]MCK4575099.1 hypothetical protein [candidate division WOR-3 bacterium]
MSDVAVLSVTNIKYPLFLTRASIRLLKDEVSPPFYRSLENIWSMMKIEVFNPLSLAKNEKDFLEKAAIVLPIFSHQRIAMIELFFSHYTENVEKFQDEMVKIFSQLEKDIEMRGKKYIEDADLLRLKSIFHTASGVSRRVFQWLISQASPENIEKIKKSKDFINLYNTASKLELFLIFIFSVLEGEIKLIRIPLIKSVLKEANSYANKYYYYSKKIGILSPTEKIKMSFPKKLREENIKEDRKLTKALMENSKRSLERDENG